MRPIIVLLAVVAVLGAASCWKRNADTCNQQYPTCPNKEKPFCDLQTQMCLAGPPDMMAGGGDMGPLQGCTSSSECLLANAPLCNSSNMCVACSGPSDDQACKDKNGATPRCGSSGACVACRPDTQSTDCGGSTPLCSSASTCVQCLSNSDCISVDKTCNTTTMACAPCQTNSDCASELCNTGGACADPTTLVYVSTTGKSCPVGPGQGTLADPYCKIQDGLNTASTAAFPSHTVIVSAGTYNENISVVPPASATYVVKAIGLGGPTISGSGGAGVVIDKSMGATSIDVTLDGFTIQGVTHGIQCIGVGATSATKLTLIRSTVAGNSLNGLNTMLCFVTMDKDVIGPNNLQGGISLQSSDFALSNLWVYKNGTGGTGGTASTFGGISITSPGTMSKKLVNATVVNNLMKTGALAASGIGCGPNTTVSNSVILDNAGGLAQLDTSNCVLDHSSWVYAAATADPGTNDQDLTSCGGTDDVRASAIFVNPTILTSPNATDYRPKTGGAAPCTLVGLGNAATAPADDLLGKTRANPPSIGAYEP